MDREQFNKRKKILSELILENELYVPMKAKEIAVLLQVPKGNRKELMDVLDELVSEGVIGITKKGKYCKPEITALVGVFESTRRGFGFVSVEGIDNDIFIKESDSKGAFHMDKVQVVITKHGDGKRKV